MALTKEHEVKIRKAAIAAYPEGDIWGAIFAGIKAYDLVKDQERKQRIFDAIDEHFDNGNDAYVVFKDYSSDEFVVFTSIQDMIDTLSDELHGFIAFGEKIFTRGDLKFAQEVFLLRDDDNGKMTIENNIGCCDCKTFKKG